MSYYFSTTTDLSVEDAITKATDELSKEGFGVLSEIDVKTTLKNKINVDMHKYVILGACNPSFAHRALLTEEHIASMLPCNVVVRENEQGQTEVFAVDPVSSMTAIDNPELAAIAFEVQQRLKTVIANI